MKFQTSLLSLAFIPMLAAFGGASEWEGVCKANVQGLLLDSEPPLNPETLQMLDFQPISKEVYAAILVRIILNAEGEGSEYISEETQLEMTAAILEHQSAAEEIKPETKLFSARIRAEGLYGNTITTTAACVALEDDCSCGF